MTQMHLEAIGRESLEFFLWSEIGRQPVKAPLAATISPYLTSPTHPTREYERRTYHKTWVSTNSAP